MSGYGGDETPRPFGFIVVRAYLGTSLVPEYILNPLDIAEVAAREHASATPHIRLSDGSVLELFSPSSTRELGALLDVAMRERLAPVKP